MYLKMSQALQLLVPNVYEKMIFVEISTQNFLFVSRLSQCNDFQVLGLLP